MEWVQWFSALLGAGSVGYLLVDRFVRTREQRGADAADMVARVSDAFDKTLQTTMRYSQEVIERMKQDDAKSESRYRELEARYEKLERKFDEVDLDRELLKGIVSKAISCKHLKEGDNDDCPVLRENKKRISARCRVCSEPKNNKQTKQER